MVKYALNSNGFGGFFLQLDESKDGKEVLERNTTFQTTAKY